MKSYLRSTPPASAGDKIKISKQEVERMIEAEVRSEMQKRENKLDALIERIQQELDKGTSCDASVRQIQTRMMSVAEKAEKALTHLNERSTPPFLSPVQTSQAQTPPLADPPVLNSHLEVKDVRTVSQNSLSIEGSSVSEFMENTKKEFERLHAENAALKAAFEDIRERSTPSPTIRRPSGVVEGLQKLMSVKKEPVDPPAAMYFPATAPVKRTGEELQPSEVDRNVKRIKSEPVEQLFPHLPQLPIPMCVPPEAARYSLPPRLKVNLGHFSNPSPGVSVVWNLEQDDPRAPPMESYSLFFAFEQNINCGIFEAWQLVEHKAVGLPMMGIVPRYRPGHRICVTVVGKDVFGRYGPFSQITNAFI